MRYLVGLIGVLAVLAVPFIWHGAFGTQRNNIIVCIGDSLTEGGPGHYMTMAKTLDVKDVQYCDVLRDRLPDWQVYNMGKGGHSTLDMQQRFERDVIALRPRLVVIMGGTNDVVGDASASEIASRLITMCKLAKKHGIIPILCTIPPTTRGHTDTLLAVNEILRTHSERTHTILVDTHRALISPLDTVSLHPMLAMPDNVHCTERGKITLGNVIYAMGVARAITTPR